MKIIYFVTVINPRTKTSEIHTFFHQNVADQFYHHENESLSRIKADSGITHFVTRASKIFDASDLQDAESDKEIYVAWTVSGGTYVTVTANAGQHECEAEQEFLDNGTPDDGDFDWNTLEIKQ